MKRKTFDKIVTFVGFGLSIFLLVAAGLLNWGATFADGAVKSQLEAQEIVIPASNGDSSADAATVAFFEANGGAFTLSDGFLKKLHPLLRIRYGQF